MNYVLVRCLFVDFLELDASDVPTPDSDSGRNLLGWLRLGWLRILYYIKIVVMALK